MLEKLIEMILKKSFQVSDSPTFKLASGKLSKYYINCKPTTLNPEGMHLIGNIIVDKISDIKIDAIGGPSSGANPIADAVSMISYQKGKLIKPFYVREKVKDHGIVNKIEGDICKGDRAIIVEDVITTGASILKAIKCAREEGLEVVGVIVLVDREEGGKEEILEQVDKFDSIIKMSDLLKKF